MAGAWAFTPRLHRDDRGAFLEAFTATALEEITGRRLELAQINTSISRQGVIRGIHAAHPPPGQAKYVMCLVGRILDVVVDLRPESPTYGRWDSVELDDESRGAIFISERLGHGFQVLSETATVVYATSSPYDPAREYAVNPLDPDIAIGWHDLGRPALSPKDASAPSLRALHDSLSQ